MTKSENLSSLLPGKMGTRVRKMAEGQINVGDHVQLNDEFLLQHQAMKQVQKIIENKLEEASEEAEQQAASIKQNAIAEAHEKAQAIIDSANQQAQIILDSTQEKLDETLKTAYENAYQDAYNNTLTTLASQIHMGESLLHQASYTSEQLKQAYVEDLTHLVYALVQSILRHELKQNPVGLIHVIEHAIESIGILHDSNASIIIHPDSLKDIGFKDEAMLKRLRFVPDTDCPRGRIYLDTQVSRWEISPELQAQLYIDAVKPKLEEKLKTIEVNEITQDETTAS